MKVHGEGRMGGVSVHARRVCGCGTTFVFLYFFH